MAEGTGGLSSVNLPLVHMGASTGVATNATGDKWTFTVPYKCEVYRAFVVIEGASTHATTFVIKFDKRPTAGSDTGRGDGDVATLNKTTANLQGKMLYKDLTSRVTLDEGDQVIVEVTTANGDACTVVPGMVVREVSEVPGNNSAMVATA